MTDTPAASVTQRRKPGRKSETLVERLQRLEQQTLAARRAVEEAEQKRLAVIGAAVMAEAESDAQFMERLRDILRARVTTKTDLATVASLIAPATQSP